jgi:hypothetical protein
MLLYPLLAAALAATLPSVDDPLKTGAKAPSDAAVVIGIEDYLLVPDVPYAKRDAKAFYDFLVYTRGVPSSRVRMLDSGAGKEQILEAVTAAGKSVAAGGTVWVYFAGHGAADASSGERLLLGDDVRQDPAAFSSRGVPVADVKKLASSGGGSVMLVVDACYGGLGRGGQELVAGKRFLVPAYEVAPKSTIVEWNAAGPDQLSGPLEAAQHGAFTYFALGAMRGWADGQLDGRKDGKVTAEEAQLYVKDALRSVQITTQAPQMTATEPSKWVLSSATEAAPKLDASVSSAKATPAAPAKLSASSPLDVTNRDGVVAWVDGLISECGARHSGASVGQWYVRFSVQPGAKMKGLMVNAPVAEGAMPTDADFAMQSCIRERIKAQKLADPGAIVKFQEHFTPAAVGQPVPQAAQVVPEPEPAAPAATTTVTETVTVGVPGLQVTTTVTDTTMDTSITGIGVDMRTSVPSAGTEARATGAAAAPVKVTFRALNGEWFDVRIDGKVVAELRNQDEATVTVSPGVHTVEFLAFMADKPFRSGRLDTAGAADAIVFAVDPTASSVTSYNHDGWR